jgi:hypothetical protein
MSFDWIQALHNAVIESNNDIYNYALLNRTQDCALVQVSTKNNLAQLCIDMSCNCASMYDINENFIDEFYISDDVNFMQNLADFHDMKYDFKALLKMCIV